MTKVCSWCTFAALCIASVADSSGKHRIRMGLTRHAAPSSIHRRVTGHERKHPKVHHSRSSVSHTASDGSTRGTIAQRNRSPVLMRREEVTVGSKATIQTDRLRSKLVATIPMDKLLPYKRKSSSLTSNTAESQKDLVHTRHGGHAKTSTFCAARCKGRTATLAACIRSCEASLLRLRNAAESVVVEKEEVRKIPFPHMSTPILREGSGKRFDGIVFAGGASIGGHDSFVARICTSKCATWAPEGLVSKIIVGELKPSLVWKEASVIEIPHKDTGVYVGPEDPRLDIVNGSRFILASVNVDVRGCQLHPTEEWKPRQMFFQPVDAIPDAQPCLIQFNEESPCKFQKNWAPLVPLHSNDIYFVYSLAPFRVLRFDKQSCMASSVPQASVTNSDTAVFPHSLHGGTRFVHGLSVSGGELYVAFAHTAPPEYEQLLVAVLLQHPSPGDRRGVQDPSFRLIGVSCPIQFTNASPREAMMITTSIINFDSIADIARVTYQTHDSENFHTEVRGIGHWLKEAYADFLKAGPVYCSPDRANEKV